MTRLDNRFRSVSMMKLLINHRRSDRSAALAWQTSGSFWANGSEKLTSMFNTRYAAACVAALAASASLASDPTATTYNPIQAIPPNIQSTPAKPLVMINLRPFRFT